MYAGSLVCGACGRSRASQAARRDNLGDVQSISSALLAAPGRPAPALGLEVQEVSDGLVIALGGDRAVYYLNSTAAAVFALCDGQSTVAESAVQLADAFGLSDPLGEFVSGCVADLRAKQVVI